MVYTLPVLVSRILNKHRFRYFLVAVLHIGFVILPLDTAGQSHLLKSNAPIPLTPTHGTQLEELPTSVSLTASNARGTYATAIFNYRFEVYDATDGLVLLASSLVSSGNATTTFSYAGPFDFSRIYQWRVQAELDGANGPWTDLWTFETPATPTPPPANPLSFTDISVAAVLSGPPSIPLGGHGAAFADATGDGQPDLYITNHFNDPVADLNGACDADAGDGRYNPAGGDTSATSYCQTSHASCEVGDLSGRHDRFKTADVYAKYFDSNLGPAHNQIVRTSLGARGVQVDPL